MKRPKKAISWERTEPYLYRNRESGRYYVRFAGQGFRALGTDRVSVARLRMAERVRNHKQAIVTAAAAQNGEVTMGDVLASFERETAEKVELGYLSLSSARDRKISLLRLKRTWPALWALKPRQITPADITAWQNLAARTEAASPPGAKRAKGSYSPRAVQKAAAALRMLLAHAVSLNAIAVAPPVKVAMPRRHGSGRKSLPSRSILSQLFQELQYPRNREIRQAVLDAGGQAKGKTQEELAAELGISLATYKRHKSGTTSGNGKDTADFARLMVFTGARVDEARNMKWSGVDFVKGVHVIPGTKSKSSDRVTPMIPECREFLQKLKAEADSDSICRVSNINRALAAASERMGIPKLTHHSLRHLFATICIESGVDIPTVSRWLGHADGGALAMRTYGHLRDEHSLVSAQKVRVF